MDRGKAEGREIQGWGTAKKGGQEKTTGQERGKARWLEKGAIKTLKKCPDLICDSQGGSAEAAPRTKGNLKESLPWLNKNL